MNVFTSFRLAAGIKLLIDIGAEVDLKDKKGQTALHVAVKQRVSKKTLGVLVKRTADVNAIDGANKTPLYVLVRNSFTFDMTVCCKLLYVHAVGALWIS